MTTQTESFNIRNPQASLHAGLFFAPAFMFVLTLCGCGGGYGSSNTESVTTTAPTAVTQPSPITPTQPALFSGSDATLASQVLGRTKDHRVATADVSGSFLLTRLLVLLTPTTTVGQANAAAHAIGATAITSSEPDSLIIVFAIPQQSNVANLQAIAKKLRAQPGIAFAWPGQMARTSILPQLTPTSSVSPLGLSHLLGSRFPQAWNARHSAPADCLPRAVSVYVFDIFGDVSLRPQFLSDMPTNSFFFDGQGPGTDLPLGAKAGHGYDVALTLAANFDADAPTGADPFANCVEVNQYEAGGYELIDAIRGLLVTVAADQDQHVIVTSSLNFVDDGFCGVNGDEVCNAQSIVAGADFVRGELQARVLQATAWAAISRNNHLENKMLVTQSVGNVDVRAGSFLAQNYLGFRSASFSSAAALATHLSDLQSLLTDTSLWSNQAAGLPDLSFDSSGAAQLVQAVQNAGGATSITANNLLLVDSGTNAPALADIKQSDFDFLGADVRAVGQGVVTTGGLGLDGTSFSTPAVAGLAAYLWNLSPALNAQPPAATTSFIRNTAVFTANSLTVPVVDAYAAVLKLDSVSGCCSGDVFAPIRLGLMDIDGDGQFTSADLQKFSDGLGLTHANASIPTAPDYSRFDLNGDGFTGGILIAPFSLDAALDVNGSVRIHSVDEAIEGFPVTFNEAALTDLQILCFYAYSPLYATEPNGQDNPLRRNILGADKCIGLQIDIALSQNIPSNSTGSLTIHLQQPASGGQLAPAANVPYRLTTTGGTASPASGVTNSQGLATATITPAANVTSVHVIATATAPANSSSVLAQGVADANVIASGDFDGNFAGTYINSCRGLIFPGGPSPVGTTTTGAATAAFSAVNGQAKIAIVSAPSDAFFRTAQILSLFGPPESFQGFASPGNGFTWTVTGAAGSTHLQITIEEVGSNCTFTFDGANTP